MIALPWPPRMPRRPPKTKATKAVQFIKGHETYLFFYLAGQEAEALRSFGRHASNVELSFTWYDAAVLSSEVRKTVKRKGVKRHGKRRRW